MNSISISPHYTDGSKGINQQELLQVCSPKNEEEKREQYSLNKILKKLSKIQSIMTI